MVQPDARILFGSKKIWDNYVDLCRENLNVRSVLMLLSSPYLVTQDAQILAQILSSQQNS